MSNSTTAVAIVGAGPYGLSLAAHLAARRTPFRIFGPPMQVWRDQMPAGMRLKSDGFASDLYDPQRRFTLARYCRDRGVAYADYGLPVKLETFVAYALEFQEQLVPMLEPTRVAEVRSVRDEFALRLENGEVVAARAVVMATGISYYGHVPELLAELPRELCTHSSAHHDLSGFRDKRVVVIGRGASATDIAALLHEAGAFVHLVARGPVDFHLPPQTGRRSLWKRITEPNLGLGPGLRSAVYTAAPGLFRQLPRSVRMRLVRRHLGPAGGWFMKDQVVGKVELHAGYDVADVAVRGSTAALRLMDRQGGALAIEVDHVIAATGYKVAAERLTLLDQALRQKLSTEAHSPILSRNFESSVPGLYFIGVSAANAFGPVMRFARGAEYTASRLGAHLARRHRQPTLQTRAEPASP